MAKSSIMPLLGAIVSAPRDREPRPPTDKQMVKEHAKHAMRRATEDWVDGRITTAEHNAVHARGHHVLSGKHPRAFNGKSGERKIKGLR